MGFIEKANPVVLNIMLTSKGRELLSEGKLTFNYFAVGDSEIDYNFIREISGNTVNSNILAPTDKNPEIISFITKNLTGATGTTGTTNNGLFNVLPSTPSMSYDVVNAANSVGFFTNSGTTFITDSAHVKQPDAMVYMSGVTGGTKLNLRKAPTYGTSGLEPAIGDYLLIKWTINNDTTGYTITKNAPTPYLTYRINAKTGTLGDNTLSVTVDRNLPNFTGYALTAKAGALIFYSANTTALQFATDYLSESVLSFLNNYQCSISVFPYWNMSIVFTEEIAGIQLADRKFSQFNSVKYGGFVSYIQNQAPEYKKLGIIHYTNDSPANVYGEEFYLKTTKLEIPTIMWHKSTTNTLGLTLVANGNKQLLTGTTKSLNIEYYNLYDINDIYLNYPVGKVFTGLKLFVIEDQELLFAMSHKSNRSWTLPDYHIGSGGSSPCPQ